MTIHID